LRIAFTLPEAGPVDARLIDAAGRVYAHTALGTRPAGTGTAELPAPRLPSGVYWVRLSQRSRAASARIVLHR
jgi:hypothetical protein